MNWLVKSIERMDVTLADLLVENGEGLEERLQSKDMKDYVSQLTALSLSDILQEPTNLSSEASQLTNSITSLCHAEYSTFLSLHKTSSLLSSTFGSFSKSLLSLMDAIPELDEQAKIFMKGTEGVQDERRKAALVLEHHDEIVDILELPQLIDTCVRNGYYQEAMDLATHASSLLQQFPDIQVIKDIDAEARLAMQFMQAQLLAQLREPVKLPALFKAVNFLRKSEIMDEPSLALAFITSRLAYLDGVFAGLDTSKAEPARHIRRYVDTWREGVYDVVTQYTTIFLERASTDSKHTQKILSFMSMFTNHEIIALNDLLSSTLPHIDDTATLTSILNQLTYCAASFARIGVDFRFILAPLFEAAVQNNFKHSIDAAADAFITTISDAQKYSRLPTQFLVTAAAASTLPTEDKVSTPQPAHIAPAVLSSYPPLGVYLNALLTALNNLRMLAPVSILSALIATLDSSLARAASAFLAYAQAQAAGNLSRVDSRRKSSEEDRKDQRLVVKAAGRVFVKVLLPYIRRALIEGVYTSQVTEASKELADHILQWEAWLGETESSSE